MSSKETSTLAALTPYSEPSYPWLPPFYDFVRPINGVTYLVDVKAFLKA